MNNSQVTHVNLVLNWLIIIYSYDTESKWLKKMKILKIVMQLMNLNLNE